LKAVYHTIASSADVASSADTIGAFNTGFDAGNLHRPTLDSFTLAASPPTAVKVFGGLNAWY
jgi:hypothetical protein